MDHQKDDVAIKEQKILQMAQELSSSGNAEELEALIRSTRPFLSLVSKAKAAKLVRTLVDLYLDMDASTGHEADLCKDCIEWAKMEKRTLLRQSLEIRLASVYYDAQKYSEALQLTGSLLKELKRMDDKHLLVEVELVESKIYHSLSNLPKCRASLTSARTAANAIYCPPKLQGSLDLQSGILHATEKDYKVAYSYFYEAFESFDSDNCPQAINALKYMLLSKIMLNTPEDVYSITMGKLALNYAGRDVEAMKAIAKASSKRSLADLQNTLDQYKQELVDDPIIHSHLDALYDNMLEQNLSRIIEAYSKIQVAHIADIINLPLSTVERKLSQMILDRKITGILDQSDGVLIILEESIKDETYDMTIETIQSMEKVVDDLYKKVKKLS